MTLLDFSAFTLGACAPSGYIPSGGSTVPEDGYLRSFDDKIGVINDRGGSLRLQSDKGAA